MSEYDYDMTDEHIDDPDGGCFPLRLAQAVTCKYCGQKNLYWHDRQLVDSRGRKHHCNVFTGKRCMDLEPKFDPIIGAPYRERP
jgi:hypothetical protein